jgi:phospholipid/cholesterol/gamma-HCH transport system substrate-binding protein
MLKNLSTELRVGLLILTGIGIIVYASVVVTGWKPGQGDTTPIVVYFDNVAGLLAGSPVQVAGVKVGQIADIELDGNRAKVTLAIFKRYTVHADGKAAIRSLGILGDKYIELTLGSATSPTLVAGDTIVLVATGSDLDSLVQTLSEILKDVKSVTGSLNAVLGGEPGQQRLDNIMNQIAKTTSDLSRITDTTNKQIDLILANITSFAGTLDRIGKENEQGIKRSLDNLAAFTGELRNLTVKNRESLDAIIANLDTFTKSLAKDGPQITEDLGKLLRDNRESLTSTVSNLDRSMAKLNTTMDGLQSISRKMDSGEGTLGKLINDTETVDQLNSALAGVNRYLTDLDRIKLDIGVHTEHLSKQDEYKSYLSIYLQPLKDRYYLLQLVDNPRGTVTTKTTTTKTGGATSTKEEHITTEQLQLSLQIGQRYFDTVFKGGLMENEFGVGVEQYFGRTDQYRIGLDVWDFGNDLGPHVKISALWRFYSNAFVVIGADDVASKESKFRDAFFGVGVRFNEDSLKPLVSSLPIPKGK